MEIKALFTGREENTEFLEKIAASFQQDAQRFARDVIYKILAERDGEIIIGIKAQVDLPEQAEGETHAIKEALLRRLWARGIQYGFTPVDNEGRTIWLYPHYGFEVFFHTPENNRARLIFTAAKKVCDELGAHLEDAHVGELGEVKMGGEVFSVQIYMQDYAPPDVREKLMLAAYLRLLLLAKQAGFTAITPGSNGAKRNES